MIEEEKNILGEMRKSKEKKLKICSKAIAHWHGSMPLN